MTTLTIDQYTTRLAYNILIQISTSIFKGNEKLDFNQITILIGRFINTLVNYCFIE